MQDFESSELEVIDRLNAYHDTKTTDALYSMGVMLVKESIERKERIESKAGTFVGFAGAILAVLVTGFSSWKTEVQGLTSAALIMLFGVILLMIGGLLGLTTLNVRQFHWIDEMDGWFAKDHLGNAEQLRKFYLIELFRTIASHEEINAEKAERLFHAEVIGTIGGLLVSITLLPPLWRMIWPA